MYRKFHWIALSVSSNPYIVKFNPYFMHRSILALFNPCFLKFNPYFMHRSILAQFNPCFLKFNPYFKNWSTLKLTILLLIEACCAPAVHIMLCSVIKVAFVTSFWNSGRN